MPAWVTATDAVLTEVAWLTLLAATPIVRLMMQWVAATDTVVALLELGRVACSAAAAMGIVRTDAVGIATALAALADLSSAGLQARPQPQRLLSD